MTPSFKWPKKDMWYSAKCHQFKPEIVNGYKNKKKEYLQKDNGLIFP
jgi:ribosomal protein L44E